MNLRGVGKYMAINDEERLNLFQSGRRWTMIKHLNKINIVKPSSLLSRVSTDQILEFSFTQI